MVFLFLIVRYINKMATDRGGGAVDGRHSNDCKHDIGPGLKSPPVSFVLYCKNGVYMNSLMYKLPNSFITGHLCFFWHCVTVLSLSRVTVRHSKYLFKLQPLLEAEDSSHTLLVPQLVSCCSLFLNWCHVVSDSTLSSNSPQSDRCCIIPIISFELSCFLLFLSYKLAQICILPSHMYKFVQNTNDIRFGDIQFVFNHEL